MELTGDVISSAPDLTGAPPAASASSVSISSSALGTEEARRAPGRLPGLPTAVLSNEAGAGEAGVGVEEPAHISKGVFENSPLRQAVRLFRIRNNTSSDTVTLPDDDVEDERGPEALVQDALSRWRRQQDNSAAFVIVVINPNPSP